MVGYARANLSLYRIHPFTHHITTKIHNPQMGNLGSGLHHPWLSGVLFLITYMHRDHWVSKFKVSHPEVAHLSEKLKKLKIKIIIRVRSDLYELLEHVR